jgi:hypothetical protein
MASTDDGLCEIDFEYRSTPIQLDTMELPIIPQSNCFPPRPQPLHGGEAGEADHGPPDVADQPAQAEIILASIDYEDASVRKAWLTEVRERMESAKQGHALSNKTA